MGPQEKHKHLLEHHTRTGARAATTAGQQLNGFQRQHTRQPEGHSGCIQQTVHQHCSSQDQRHKRKNCGESAQTTANTDRHHNRTNSNQKHRHQTPQGHWQTRTTVPHGHLQLCSRRQQNSSDLETGKHYTDPQAKQRHQHGDVIQADIPSVGDR